MINGGPDPLFVKAMVVPSREVVVRFSPVDVTARPPEYRIASTPNATMATIKTSVMRFIDPSGFVSRPTSAQVASSKWAASRDRGKVSSEVLQRLGRADVDAHLE